jgi:hypothetical protein
MTTLEQIDTTMVLDFSNMFKNCVNLTAVPSMEMIENEVLAWSCPDGKYYTYQGRCIFSEEGMGPDKRETATDVSVLKQNDPNYTKIAEKYPEYFI